MNIKLIKLSFENFKGTVKREVNFNGADTDIFGDNAAGKSTIYDAFSWLLFNKNSAGETKFDVKPYGVERPSVTVEGVIRVDERVIQLKKTLTETYVQKRGSEESTFTGHSTEYWINSIPKKVGEYTAFIDSIVSEEMFKRLTNATYFLNMKKPDMRKVLIDMVGNISNDLVAGTDTDLQSLVLEIEANGYTIEELQKRCKERIKLYSSEQDGITPRIDEVNKSLEAEEPDYSDIEAKIQKGAEYIAKIDDKLLSVQQRVNDISKSFGEIMKVKTAIEDYKREMIAKANEERNKLIELKNQINLHATSLKGQFENLSQRENDLEDQIATKKLMLGKYAEDWKAKSQEKKNLFATEFTPIEIGSSNCNACGQTLPSHMIDSLNQEAKTRFDEQKAKGLEKLTNEMAEIETSGKRESTLKTDRELALKEVKDSKEKLSLELEIATSRLVVTENKLASTLPTTEIDLTGDEKYEELNAKLNSFSTETDNSDSETVNKLMDNKKIVQAQIDELKVQLSIKGEREKAQKRIQELAARGKELAGLISDEKKTQYACEKFSKAKSTMLESTINGMFSNLTFRLFETQINEGVKDDCTPLINGVEYKDASHSEQIRAQMDIINAMQKAGDIYPPVFIDNAEACTHLRTMNCQVVRLIVSAKDKQIRVQARTSEGDAENRKQGFALAVEQQQDFLKLIEEEN